MENFLSLPNKNTPEIIFLTDGTLTIKGRSHPSDVMIFYKPVFDWLETLKNKLPKKITLTVELDYIDTPSTIMLLKLCRAICNLADTKTKVSVFWKYDSYDEDMLDLGKIYELRIKFPFEFIEKPAGSDEQEAPKK